MMENRRIFLKKLSVLPALTLDLKTIDKIEDHPYADNIYIRMEWRDIQKNKGKLEFRKEWNWILDMAERSNKSWSFLFSRSRKNMIREINFTWFKNRNSLAAGYLRNHLIGMLEFRPLFFIT